MGSEDNCKSLKQTASCAVRATDDWHKGRTYRVQTVQHGPASRPQCMEYRDLEIRITILRQILSGYQSTS